MKDPFESMYIPYAHEAEAFGENFSFPKKYVHGEDIGCALYRKEPGNDGQTVEVFCCALPARFYILKVLPGVNSCDEPKAGYTISTGSGQAELAAKIADAISQGMLDFKPGLKL
jgi:hypothetical protein